MWGRWLTLDSGLGDCQPARIIMVSQPLTLAPSFVVRKPAPCARTRMYLAQAMGFLAFPTPTTPDFPHQTIFLCTAKGQPVLRTMGIDIAKRTADGRWLVRPATHRARLIRERTQDTIHVLTIAGYAQTTTDKRTGWTTWSRAA